MKLLGTILFFVVFFGVGYFFFTQSGNLQFSQENVEQIVDSPLGETLSASTTLRDSSASGTAARKDIFSYPENNPASATTSEPAKSKPLPAAASVTYTAGGWTPAVAKVRKGGTVTFVNESGHDFQPAADPHPIHLSYETFDAKNPVADGESWQFTFDKKGMWGYHDHLNPSFVGVIMVE